jgi:large subunit ribosomal protein L35
VPKQKTNKAAKKRFKLTGGGRLLRRHAMKSHNLEKKSAKRRRAFRRDHAVDRTDAREIRRLLGR